MNHQTVEFLARDRISDLRRDVAHQAWLRDERAQRRPFGAANGALRGAVTTLVALMAHRRSLLRQPGRERS
jgi:hypothetical protein